MRRAALLSSMLLFGMATTTLAGPNAGGSLIIHHNSALSYSAGISYCGEANLEDCYSAVTSVTSSEPVVCHVMAAFAEGSSPRVKAVTFGMEYGDSLDVLDFDSCGDFSLPTNDWPSSGSGIAIAWNSVHSDQLTEVAWFAVESSGSGEQQLALTAHPTQGGQFADDSVPAVVDAIGAYGVLGFHAAGVLPCPPSPSLLLFGEQSAAYPITLVASDDMPNVIFVDPGVDDFIELSVQQPVVGTPPTMELEFKIQNAKTGALVATHVVEVDADFNAVPTTQFPQSNGLAKVSIRALSGDGEVFDLGLRGSDPQDVVTFNDLTLAMKHTANYVYPFWVPSAASSFDVGVLDGSPSEHEDYFHLYTPQNELYLTGQTGSTYHVDGIPMTDRNGSWHLHILSSGNQLPGEEPRGPLTLTLGPDYEQELSWTPDIAFRMGAPLDDVRAQIPPGMIMSTSEPSLYFFPAGRWPETQSPYVAAFPESCALISSDPEEFVFVSWPNVPATTYVKNLDDSLDVVVEYSVDEDSTAFETILPLETESFPLGGASAHVLRLRIATGKYKIASDAPGFTKGPSPAIGWTRSCPLAQATTSPDCWFWVPKGTVSFNVEVEAYRYCAGEAECAGKPYAYRIYPPVTVTLTPPDGVPLSPLVVDETDKGRLRFDQSVGDWDGQIWKVNMTFDGGDLGEHTGLKARVAFDEQIPPYFSVHGPDRLVVPAATPRCRWVQRTGPFEGQWSILPASNVYFNRAEIEFQNALTLPFGGPLPAEISVPLMVTPATKDSQIVRLSTWIGTADGTVPAGMTRSGQQRFYIFGRPLGLGAGGTLRTTDGGVPGGRQQFVSLFAPMDCNQPDGDYGETPGQDCLESLQESTDLGFRTVSVSPMFIQGLFNQGYHTTTSVHGSALFARPQSEPGDWEAYEQGVLNTVDRDGIAAIDYAGEPLEFGHSIEKIVEAGYIFKKYDQRHPVFLHEEPDLRRRRLLAGVADIVADEHYSVRHPKYGGVTALCDFVTRLTELESAAVDDQATGIFQLAGFTEGKDEHDQPLWWTAGADTATIQAMAALLLGTDLVFQFWRVGYGFDVKVDNPRLWNGYHEDLLPFADSLSSWTSVIDPYRIGLGPEGVSVVECELPPVVYGYGLASARLGTGHLATWFALGNLGHENAQTIVVDWSDLELPADSVWLEVDGQSDRFAVEGQITIVPENEVSWTVPPTGWVFGRLVWEVDNPSAVNEQFTTIEREQIQVLPQPARVGDGLRLRSTREFDADLTLFDLQGRLVLDFGRRALGVGINEIRSDDRRIGRLASGIYFLRIQPTGSHGFTKRVVVTR